MPHATTEQDGGKNAIPDEVKIEDPSSDDQGPAATPRRPDPGRAGSRGDTGVAHEPAIAIEEAVDTGVPHVPATATEAMFGRSPRSLRKRGVSSMASDSFPTRDTATTLQKRIATGPVHDAETGLSHGRARRPPTLPDGDTRFHQFQKFRKGREMKVADSAFATDVVGVSSTTHS